MKPHPKNRPIQGDPFVPNRFIFGDAVDDKALEPYEYVVHTEVPAFVCRLVGNDDTPFTGRDAEGFASVVLYDEQENITHYVCNEGFRLFDFNFWEEPLPTAAELQRICDAAMDAYRRLNAAYAEREAGVKQREFRFGPTEPLPPAERASSIAALAEQARAALDKPLEKMQLAAAVQLALSGGDQAVFTEAQLALLSEPAARELLIGTARDCIAFPEVVRTDGTIASYELWALPFAFSRAQGGFWWHFPLLERVEAALAEALEVPEKAILWLSPTVFNVDMLNERACQQLVHLAPVMDAGCDFAPADPDASRATFEAASKTAEPQLVLCWIPFLVERGTLSMEQARLFGRKALDAAMPLVQQAIAAEMEYGEAELFAPMPWWEALSSGVRAWNRKRLGLTVALVAGQLGGIDKLEAVAEYQPEQTAFNVQVVNAEDGALLGVAPWLLVPDVAPDREFAYSDLAECLAEVGIPLSHRASRQLH
ncbi:hypothetical protein QU487_22720 [Crenobacter sp. SG2305]|uniref:hypothetical protein n=1 Tax=Crenobacter oryzisoli TaxID=3056844 RepID=UPI0025AA500E|nr:hypothetical protein [Crenobacter sp. SG2305]MDN0085514.1 hypothetical protein [Crenobacter sp. SG2305]